MMLDLSLFQLAGAKAAHASQRQALISENIANADTPGYRAKDLKDFVAVYGGRTDGFVPRATRSGHAMGGEGRQFATEALATSARGAESPNANDVSLEEQMLNGVAAQRSHDMAIGIYGKAVAILKAGLGKGR